MSQPAQSLKRSPVADLERKSQVIFHVANIPRTFVLVVTIHGGLVDHGFPPCPRRGR